MAQEEKKRVRRSDTLMYTAYQTIKEEICTGVIRSGELLSETQLAARMGISRTPLREALAALENEGLVEIKRGVGAKVRPLSFGDMIHVYELRKVLEPLAAQTAVLHISREELEEYRRRFQSLLELKNEPVEVQVVKDTEVDWQFHMMIVERSESPYLAPMMNLIMPTIRRLQMVAYLPEGYQAEESVAQHMALIDVLERGNIHEVGQQLRAHLTWSLESFLNTPTLL